MSRSKKTSLRRLEVETLFFGRIGLESSRRKPGCFQHINHDAEDGNERPVKNDIPSAAVYSVYAVYTADDSCYIRQFCFCCRDAFCFLQIGNGSHGKQVGNEIDHDGKIDKDIELL